MEEGKICLLLFFFRQLTIPKKKAVVVMADIRCKIKDFWSKSIKSNFWNFYFNEKKSDSIEIFQIFQRINTDGWQRSINSEGKKGYL